VDLEPASRYYVGLKPAQARRCWFLRYIWRDFTFSNGAVSMGVVKFNEFTLKIRNGATFQIRANTGSEAIKKLVKAQGCTPDNITVVDVREVIVNRK
jgi:hypothetical protein